MIATAGIVELEGVGRDAVEERGVARRRKVVGAPDRSAAPGLHGEKRRLGPRRFLGGRACEGGAEGIEDMALRLLDHLGRKLIVSNLRDESPELFRDRLLHQSSPWCRAVEPRSELGARGSLRAPASAAVAPQEWPGVPCATGLGQRR